MTDIDFGKVSEWCGRERVRARLKKGGGSEGTT